jgi:hypothetical protein
MGSPTDPRQIALNLLVGGVGKMALSDFKMEFNPTPGWRISIKPPDKTALPPAGAGLLSQTVYLMNLTNAPFQMQVKVSYRFGAQPVSEVGTFTRLPPI